MIKSFYLELSYDKYKIIDMAINTNQYNHFLKFKIQTFAVTFSNVRFLLVFNAINDTAIMYKYL